MLSFAALALSGSQLLKEFQKDPINSIRYSMGMEHRQDGHSIAQQVYKHYFLENIKKPTFEQYGEVINCSLVSDIEYLIKLIFLVDVRFRFFQMR